MKVLITALLFLFTSFAFSQDTSDNFLIEKGTWIAEGNFGLNTRQSEDVFNSTTTDEKTFNFSIAPKIGYLIADNFILGLGLEYNYSKYEREGARESTIGTHTSISNSYGVFPYIKKFFPIGKKLSLHLAANTGFSFGNTTYNTNNNIDGNTESESTSKNFSINVIPGINYRLHHKILVQANFGALGYNHIEIDFDDSESRTSDSLGLNLNLSTFTIGFIVLL